MSEADIDDLVAANTGDFANTWGTKASGALATLQTRLKADVEDQILTNVRRVTRNNSLGAQDIWEANVIDTGNGAVAAHNLQQQWITSGRYWTLRPAPEGVAASDSYLRYDFVLGEWQAMSGGVVKSLADITTSIHDMAITTALDMLTQDITNVANVEINSAPTAVNHSTRKDYVDSGDAATLASAQSYADGVETAANAYADGAETSAISTANAYTDGEVTGLADRIDALPWKENAYVATQVNTNIAVAPASIDTASFGTGWAEENRRVLLMGQTDPIENGLWVWIDVGVPMVRPSDFVARLEGQGAAITVTTGTFANQIWKVDDRPIIDTDAITFTRIDSQTGGVDESVTDLTTLAANGNLVIDWVSLGGPRNFRIDLAGFDITGYSYLNPPTVNNRYRGYVEFTNSGGTASTIDLSGEPHGIASFTVDPGTTKEIQVSISGTA